MKTVETSELRALEVFSDVPRGCFLFMQQDRSSEPHVHVGESAVIDPRDTEVINGEAYLIEWQNSGGRAICQVRLRFNDTAKCDVADFCPLNRPRSKSEFEERLRTGRDLFCSDTGLDAQYLPSYIKGRVIGIYKALEFLPRALPAR